MDRPWWQGWVARLSNAKRGTQGGRKYARLSLRRLEDRRVLNAAAVVAPPSVTVTEDAKGAVVINAAPADDSPDVFSIVREEVDGKDFLQVSFNGAVVFSQELDQVASVTIKGSGDQETLVVDFGDGNPIPVGGINFAGATDGSVSAAPDSILFVNGSVDSVAYSLAGSTDGQISLTTGSTTSTVEYSGNVQTITDSLTAATRTFTVGGTIADVGLSAGNAAGMSQLAIGGGTQVTFADPTQSLALDDTTTSGLAIAVNGLDSGFQADLTIAGGQASQVQFLGATSIGTGNLQVTGGSVTVDAEVGSLGGAIEISAYEKVLVSPAGALSSPGAAIDVSAPSIEIDGKIAAVNGGSIRLDAGSNGTLLVSGRVDASSSADGLIGGSVELLGA
ncbi:MAG TPA: hypothetical protein VL475_04175, partial [Planctomycetaceae bacterium]|nr:hypothetical protein [Planctomycetaceae bacterium]